MQANNLECQQWWSVINRGGFVRFIKRTNFAIKMQNWPDIAQWFRSSKVSSL